MRHATIGSVVSRIAYADMTNNDVAGVLGVGVTAATPAW